MSEVLLTAAFGSRNRNSTLPRDIRVFAQLVVGGSGVYLFHSLNDLVPPLRIRADDAALADVLMAGVAMADSSMPLIGEGEARAKALLEKGTDQADVYLSADDAATIANAASMIDVAGTITFPPGELGENLDFRGWDITRAAASKVGPE